MKKLGSLVTLMGDPKSLQAASPHNVGTCDGFAKFSSPNKRSIGEDGFAQIACKKKRSRNVNVGKDVDFTCNSQARMKKIRNHDEKISTHSRRHIHAESKQGTGQHVQTHSSGQSFPAQSQSRPNQLRRLQPQSKIHSSAQSQQRSADQPEPIETRSNQSRQLSAQSCEHTPEDQSQQQRSADQPEPIETTPNQSRQLSAQSRQQTHEAQSQQRRSANNVSWTVGSVNSDGRLRVEVIDGTLEPSYQCSAKNRQIMYEQLEPTGYNWKSVSKLTQEFYFEEFKKYFVWRQSEAVIYDGWLLNARKKYSELVSVARSEWENHKRRDNRIGMNVYNSWTEFWKSSKFQEKSLIQKNNRRSGVDGHPSTHTSGSASHRTVAARMKLQIKRDPTADELFKETHSRHLKKKIPIGVQNEADMDDEDEEHDEDGETIWIDKKSQQTYETFLKLCEQQEQSGQPVDRNTLFLDAVGGPNKKNRVYGVGSSQGIFYPSKVKPFTSSSVAQDNQEPSVAQENQELKHELIEMKDRMKALEDQLARFIQANSVQVPHPQSPVDADLGGQNDGN